MANALKELHADTHIVTNLKSALADAKTIGNAGLAAQLQKTIEGQTKTTSSKDSRHATASTST